MSRSINPRPQFFDSAGDPIVLGKMYFFESGTDTPKSTFADVNLVIPNAHPVVLTGDGRLPNVFFDGAARQKLTDSDDVQLWDVDPVGDSGLGGNFEQWVSSVSYSLNAIVLGSDGNFYKSFTSGNLGNDPTTTPTEWEQVEFVNTWNTNVTYSIGDTVKGSDNLFYISQTNGNIGNDPTSDVVNWGSPFGTDLGGAKLTNVGAGTTLTDGVNLGQVQAEGYIWCGTMTGTADAGVLTPSPAITAYAAGMRFAWKASANVNTGPMTIAISGLSAIAAQNDRAALVAGDHAADDIYMGILDTTSTIQIMKIANDATPGAPTILPALLLAATDLPPGDLTFTRASIGLVVDAAGIVQTAAVNVIRNEFAFDDGEHLGWLLEDARTLHSLWNRDLTNAAWVKTNITAAKDATGVDAVASSASTLTATAANGTCFQSVTIASAGFAFGVDVKRKTGSGTVEITMDGGSTFTDITSSINSSTFTRVSATQTLANPNIGFRIVTNGDEIEVDFAGFETGPAISSRIATTTTAITRAADVATMLTSAFAFNTLEGTMVCEFVLPGQLPSGPPLKNHVIAVFNNDSGAFKIMLIWGTDNVVRATITDNSVNQADIGTTVRAINTRLRVALAWKENDFAFYINGAQEGTDVSGTVPLNMTKLHLGNEVAGVSEFLGHVDDFLYFPRRLSNTELAELSVL